MVVAPATITAGSVPGEPIVFVVGAASPVDTVTVTPAATAASSAIRSRSR